MRMSLYDIHATSILEMTTTPQNWWLDTCDPQGSNSCAQGLTCIASPGSATQGTCECSVAGVGLACDEDKTRVCAPLPTGSDCLKSNPPSGELCAYYPHYTGFCAATSFPTECKVGDLATTIGADEYITSCAPYNAGNVSNYQADGIPFCYIDKLDDQVPSDECIDGNHPPTEKTAECQKRHPLYTGYCATDLTYTSPCASGTLVAYNPTNNQVAGCAPYTVGYRHNYDTGLAFDAGDMYCFKQT